MGNRGVKDEKISWKHIAVAGGIGILLFYGNGWLLGMNVATTLRAALYTATLLAGFLGMLAAGLWSSRLLKNRMTDDPFNAENESFMQETRLLKNDDSFNFPTEFVFRRRRHSGWINVVNPFRASIVLGTPGSGKSYALINNYIKQAIEKGYALYVYDFKFDDLSVIAYNHLRKNLKAYGTTTPKFYVINFDDPRRSHRCNPLAPNLMSDITDAYEASYVIMLNLNRSWIQKQGDFFVESPIVLLAAIIWFLKIYDGGKYCTFPHAIELLNKPYEELFTVLMAHEELENYLSPFVDAWKGGAAEQLMGQIASAKIPLSRMISPQLYWVMSGDDFTLDINNPEEPKILCVGNNPDRQNIYGAALGLYNSRIVKLINRKKQLKSCVVIDELPTIYIRGLDNLIATARSNKVSVCLGIQDFSQLERDYGEKEAKVIINTVGNKKERNSGLIQTRHTLLWSKTIIFFSILIITKHCFIDEFIFHLIRDFSQKFSVNTKEFRQLFQSLFRNIFSSIFPPIFSSQTHVIPHKAIISVVQLYQKHFPISTIVINFISSTQYIHSFFI